MDVVVCCHKGTLRVAFMECSLELVQCLKDLLSLPLPSLLHLLSSSSTSCAFPVDSILRTPALPAHHNALDPPQLPPLSSRLKAFLDAAKPDAGRAAQGPSAPGPSTPARDQPAPATTFKAPVLESALFSHCTRSPHASRESLKLFVYSQAMGCCILYTLLPDDAPNHFSCHERVRFQPDSRESVDVESWRPLFCCSLCDVVSHSRFAKCQGCKKGVFSWNVAVLDNFGYAVESAPPAALPASLPSSKLTGNFVVRGLRVLNPEDYVVIYGDTGQPYGDTGVVPLPGGSQPRWICPQCKLFISEAPNDPCPWCPGSSVGPLTFVTVGGEGSGIAYHPWEESKAQGTFSPAPSTGADKVFSHPPAPSRGETQKGFSHPPPCADAKVLVAESLQVFHEFSSSMAREEVKDKLMMDAGIERLQDKRLVQLLFGMKELEGILIFGLSRNCKTVLTEVFKSALQA